MNTILCRKLFVAAPPFNSNLCCKLFVIHPFHFRNVFSTEAHSQSLFAQFASSKLNMSEVVITRMFKLAPSLKKLPTLHTVEQLLRSLSKRGCTDVQIAKIMRSGAKVIGKERSVEPKIKLLEDLGFEGQNLARLLRINPSILSLSLKNELLPKIEYLKNVFGSQDALVKALVKAPRLLNYNLETTLKPSLAFWEGWGFHGTDLFKFLKIQPGALSIKSLTPARVDLIHKIGVDKESKMFKYILGIVVVSRTETLEAKIENLKLCGLSAEETYQLLGAVPMVFYLSKENVCEKMNILVNNMELPANYVVKHPSLLQLGLEKTMRPRFLVWQKIKSLDNPKLPLLTFLTMPETKFVSKIIKEHPESKTLSTIYENAISNASNQTKSSTKT